MCMIRENFYIHLIREECKIFITNDKILFLHLIRTSYELCMIFLT